MSTPTPPASALGEMIQVRRLALGLSQEELAARVCELGSDIRQADISRIERGRVALPRRRRLEHIATALGLSLGELLAASGWAGAGETFATALVEEPAPPPATPTLILDTPASPPGPVGPPFAWRLPDDLDASSTVDAVNRLRAAISEARESMTRARTLEECYREATRQWDSGPGPRGST